MSASKKTAIKRFMRALERPQVELAFLLQDVEDPVNVGAIFRVADALKVQQVVLAGITARPPHKLITKVGRGKDTRISWRSAESIEQAITELRQSGYHIAAIEISDQALSYDEIEYPQKICLLVGHEDHGVTRNALALADKVLFIPMYGKGASLNVHVALSVVAFHVLQAARAREFAQSLASR